MLILDNKSYDDDKGKKIETEVDTGKEDDADESMEDNDRDSGSITSVGPDNENKLPQYDKSGDKGSTRLFTIRV